MCDICLFEVTNISDTHDRLLGYCSAHIETSFMFTTMGAMITQKLENMTATGKYKVIT